MSEKKVFPCRDCSAQVSWARTNNGKHTLLDEQPDPERGDVAFMIGLGEQDPIELAVKLQGDVLEHARAGGVELRTVHYFTCPARKAAKTRTAA